MAFPGILTEMPCKSISNTLIYFQNRSKEIYNLVIEKRNKEIKYKPNSQVVYINKFDKKQN